MEAALGEEKLPSDARQTNAVEIAEQVMPALP